MNRKKFPEDFVKIYCCGPTVYCEGHHLGHARTYIMTDLINRTMNNIMGQKTHFVLNVTDIDDKIINRAKEMGIEWTEVSKMYEKSFFESMAKLNVKLPDVIIRVSEVIPQIVKYIQVIIDKGFAYVTTDGSVYFDTDAYKKAGYEFNDMVDEEEEAYYTEVAVTIMEQKRNKRDFALWKGRKENEVGFPVEFLYMGKSMRNNGRPGWHIECSCMINETLGESLDIHIGGIDLKFPHHHNEILQANAYHHPLYLYNDNWCEYFIHIGHLCIKGQKMSKSLKNFTTIDEALKIMSPNQMRWMFIIHKMCEQMDFGEDGVTYAKSFDSMITNFFNRVINFPFDRKNVKYDEKEFELNNYFCDVSSNLKHHTNIPQRIIFHLENLDFDLAARLLAELINRTNTYISSDHPNESLVRKIYNWVMWLVTTLGFSYGVTSSKQEIGPIMNVLISTRNELRAMTRDKNLPKEMKQKIFEILDKERNVELTKIGITLQDTKDSSLWFV